MAKGASPFESHIPAPRVRARGGEGSESLVAEGRFVRRCAWLRSFAAVPPVIAIFSDPRYGAVVSGEKSLIGKGGLRFFGGLC